MIDEEKSHECVMSKQVSRWIFISFLTNIFKDQLLFSQLQQQISVINMPLTTKRE